MGNLNQIGVSYNYTAVGGRSDFGMLSAEAADHMAQLESAVSKRWSEQTERPLFSDVHGCLVRLAGFLLQVRRMADHARRLAETTGEPGVGMAIRGDETCFDFESMLFQARGALDRLTLAVARRYGSKSHRSRTIKDILERNAPKTDQAARTARGLFDHCKMIDRVVIDRGSEGSLRSLVQHRTGVIEESENAFTVHFLEDGRRLIFDFRALGYPVLTTAHTLSQEVPFIVLNTLAAYTRLDGLAMTAFEPIWNNPVLDFNAFIDATGSGPEFSLLRLVPNGFEIVETKHLSSDVLGLTER